MIDIELYGGKRGLLEHVCARALFAVGAYRDSCDIEWSSVGRLVFVCKGNICRSPYASARARSIGIHAVSFGLAANEGAPADPAASRNASLRGLDLSQHRSTRMESTAFQDGDLAIVFEPRHVAEVRRLSSGGRPVSLLGVWSRPIHAHIQDPYGRGDRYFQRCFSIIDANIAALAEKMAGNARGGGRESLAGSLLNPPRNDPGNRTVA